MNIVSLARLEITDTYKKLNGPMGPVYGAKEFYNQMIKSGQALRLPLCQILRVNWYHTYDLQINEGPNSQRKEMTGMDSLIIVLEGINNQQFFLFQDQGHQALPIGMAFHDDADWTFTSIYNKVKEEYYQLPSDDDFKLALALAKQEEPVLYKKPEMAKYFK